MLLALALAATPIEQTAWWECLKKEAARLEPSGERPRDIAVAAIDACHSNEPALGTQLMLRVRKKMVGKVASEVVRLRSRP